VLQLLTCLGAAMLALARQVPSGSKRRLRDARSMHLSIV
jgi:hypothetical protein